MDIIGLSLSLLPLVAVFLGIVLLKKSGSIMVVFAVLLTAFLSWAYFHTEPLVIYGGIVYGILSSLGIALAVIFAMFMVFLMQITGALKRISESIHNVAGTMEEKALFVGMGFGSFVTALGLVAPTLFPPLLVAMGFAPFAAVAIAVLGYDPLCSFALLSLPITLPAETATKSFGIPVDPQAFAMNISMFLPVVSVGFALAILWVVGKWGAIKRSWLPAVLSGLVLSTSALIFVYTAIIPLRVVGVAAGALSMISLILYSRAKSFLGTSKIEKEQKVAADGSGVTKSNMSLLKAASPWIILIGLVSVVGIPEVGAYLAGLLNPYQIIPVFANVKYNLSVLSQAYTWIFVASILAIFTLGATREQVKEALNMSVRRVPGPFISYSLFFAMAYLMYYSGGVIANGTFIPGPIANPAFNMDAILGAALAAAIGSYYAFASPFPGFIGSVVGGSETASNVMFAKIQHVAVSETIGADKFGVVYGAHAVAGGISSAITPAKINNACATLGEGGHMESKVISINIWVALGLTLVTSIMTYLFIMVGVGF